MVYHLTVAHLLDGHLVELLQPTGACLSVLEAEQLSVHNVLRINPATARFDDFGCRIQTLDNLEHLLLLVAVDLGTKQSAK